MNDNIENIITNFLVGVIIGALILLYVYPTEFERRAGASANICQEAKVSTTYSEKDKYFVVCKDKSIHEIKYY
jgi:hypothetical protein